MRSHGTNKTPSGFTLIEVMVSLTILAGLLAITYSGFRVAVTMWEKANERSQAFEQRQTVLEVLREQVRGILPVSYTVVQGTQRQSRVAFEGTSNTLRFVSATSWRDGPRAVPRWIELKWDGRLKIDERRILSPLNTPSQESLWHLELETFQEFRFRYLQRQQPGRRAEWLETWDMQQRRELPAAVAVEGKVGGEPTSLVVPLDYAEVNWKGFQFQ
jgi:prepilin-type N-terminal cleavage/methylation domain-containing protein